MTALEAFTQAYYEAIYFTETGDQGQPDAGAEIAHEAKLAIEKECEEFLSKAGLHGYSGRAIELAGHDFWLTRNGHGAGFWDGDWAEPKASELTDLSDTFGPCEIYQGDDGFLYAS